MELEGDVDIYWEKKGYHKTGRVARYSFSLRPQVWNAQVQR